MEERSIALQAMQICRFCLDETGPFANIFERRMRQAGGEVSLPLQVMACAAIEVYQTDGMPSCICDRCNCAFNDAYRFKKACKRAEEALKHFLTTGNLIKPKSAGSVATKRSLVASKAVDVHDDDEEEDGEPPNRAKVARIDVDVKKERQIAATSDGDDGERRMLDESSKHDEDDDDVEEMLVETTAADESSCSADRAKVVETNVFPCMQCERTFPLKQLLELHERNHERERNNPCELCDRKFFTKYDLAKHVQSHTMVKPFTCVICGKTFAREPLLHRHEKTHVNVPKYVCPHCDKRFLSREDFDAHLEKHKKKRPFICRLCDKRFVFKQGLERHEASHADEKPHKCNYCEASFTSPIKLMRHITSHAGLRPYPCKVCGRTFLLSHHLTRHLRSHYSGASGAADGVGQHKCDVCSMSFRRKDSLINHSAIHSMVNLKCVICQTAFGSAKEVKEHITTHLAGLPYPCDKCDYSFETQEQLEEHELKHAEMEYEEQIEEEVTKEAQMEDQTIIVTHDGIVHSYEVNEDDEEEDDDEVTEYTITNDDDNNPQVVPRKRKRAVSKYANFLKEELGSDAEIVIGTDDDNEEDEGDEVVEAADDDDGDAEGIKPIVRSEGTKVYTRKHSAANKSSSSPPEEERNNNSGGDGGGSENDKAIAMTDAAASIDIESLGLTQEFVKDLPTEQYVDMRFGSVIYKVKKVTMKKTEFEAAAKQGNVELKDGILVKKTIQSVSPPKTITIENIIDEPKSAAAAAAASGAIPKQIVKKTYVGKKQANVSNQMSKNEDGDDDDDEVESDMGN